VRPRKVLRTQRRGASLSNGGGGVGGEGVLESAAPTGGMMRTRSRGPSLSSVVLMASRSSATPRIAVSPPTPASSSSAMATEPAAAQLPAIPLRGFVGSCARFRENHSRLGGPLGRKCANLDRQSTALHAVNQPLRR